MRERRNLEEESTRVNTRPRIPVPPQQSSRRRKVSLPRFTSAEPRRVPASPVVHLSECRHQAANCNVVRCGSGDAGGSWEKELPVGKHIHLNRLDRLRLTVNHTPNSFGRVATECRLAAMKTDGGGNLLNPHGLAVNVKDSAGQFLTTLGFSAHMTAKHGYLRLA